MLSLVLGLGAIGALTWLNRKTDEKKATAMLHHALDSVAADPQKAVTIGIELDNMGHHDHASTLRGALSQMGAEQSRRRRHQSRFGAAAPHAPSAPMAPHEAVVAVHPAMLQAPHPMATQAAMISAMSHPPLTSAQSGLGIAPLHAPLMRPGTPGLVSRFAPPAPPIGEYGPMVPPPVRAFDTMGARYAPPPPPPPTGYGYPGGYGGYGSGGYDGYGHRWGHHPWQGGGDEQASPAYWAQRQALAASGQLDDGSADIIPPPVGAINSGNVDPSAGGVSQADPSNGIDDGSADDGS